MNLHLYIILLFGFTTLISCDGKTEKVCSGTNLNIIGTSKERYEVYKRMYENCTYVDGNMTIVLLDRQYNYDLNFLSKVKEVTGYVLIASVFADYVPLTSLRIIRGRTLYKANDEKHYSLYVSLNYKPNSTTVGLKELRFSNLHEILNGNVLFSKNKLLCYERSINWRDILTKSEQNAYFQTDSGGVSRMCGECNCPPDKDSGKKHCWGSEPSMCQELIKCVPQCDGRCYGERPSECCHPQCVGGCTGSTNRECLACKNFNNDGVCEAFCPREYIYDPDRYKFVENPNAKYTYGTLCVDNCPEHLVVDYGVCVRDCGPGRIADEKTRKCESCDGECQKICPGTEAFANGGFINSLNIANFTGCTVIAGNIRILANTFEGDRHFNISPLHPSNLSVLSTIKAINGYLMIQGEHEDFTSLGFFKNLEKIYGRQLDNHGAALSIIRTPIKKLGFRSPFSIFNGRIIVVQNPNLCYVSLINWQQFIKKSDQIVTIVRNKDDTECREQGNVCNDQCSDDGCWGAGDDHCLSCRNYKLNGRCLASCNYTQGIYIVQGSKECGLCHKECDNECDGPGDDQCQGKCKKFKDGPHCVAHCPENKYPDQNNMCQQCHENCLDECTGPGNTIGEGACNSCEKVLLDVDNTILQCMTADSECEDGYYTTLYKIGTNNTMACKKCDRLCKTCRSEGPSACDECIYYKEELHCVQKCSDSYYPSGSMCKRVTVPSESDKSSETLTNLKRRVAELESARGGGSGSGVSYIRYGNKRCPNSSQLIYDGYIASSYYNYGGGVQYLCLPSENIEWPVGFTSDTTARSFIYGTEFKYRKEHSSFQSKQNTDILCSVCDATDKSQVRMFPAKQSCPSGWTLEYKGVMMSSNTQHRSAEFVCVDFALEAAVGSNPKLKGALLYTVEVRTGALPSPPYINGNKLGCAVCTK